MNRRIEGVGPGAGAESIHVPHTALSPEALRGLVEELVTRDGTDYGPRERSLEEKVASVMRQLERGEAKIVFDPVTGTANVVVAR
ncbi:MAG: YheU family protein [Candidatus Binatia bacterium]